MPRLRIVPPEREPQPPADAVTPLVFGELLRRARTAAGMTQQELAERATVSVRAISDLERGVIRRAQRETLHLLADALALTGEARERFEVAARRRSPAPAAPSFAPVVPIPAPPHNLPSPVTPLVGREGDLMAACTLLRRDAVRLVTVTGFGGVGKTRLALDIGRELLGDFPDGVWFVPLAAIRDPAFVVAAITDTIGADERGAASRRDALITRLRTRRTLLVLDNCEHVIAAAGEIAALLAACPYVKVLATSRAPLRLHGEHEWSLEPLPLPNEKTPTPTSLERVPSVALFCQRAQAVRPDFALTSANALAVAAICRRLDGLPLAIELAAARLKMLQPVELLRRLRPMLPELVDGARDLPARQRTMRDTIAWSHDLLGDVHRRLFRRLVIFAGGWTLEDAEALVHALDNDPGDIHPLLRTLVDESLVRADQAGETTRFAMLGTVWEYGLEQLRERGEEAEVERAHAEVFAAMVVALAPDLAGGNQQAALARLDPERDNLRAALAWARATGATETGQRMAGAVWPFWYLRGQYTEGRQWCREMLALPDAGATGVAERSRRAEVLIGASILANEQQDVAAAREFAEEARTIYAALGAKGRLGQVLNILGAAAHYQGDLRAARGCYEESLAAFRDLHHPLPLAVALLNLGGITQELGDYATARRLLEESLALLHTLPQRTHNLGTALQNLAENAWLTGDLDRATQLNGDALAVCRETGYARGIANSLCNLAEIAAHRGDCARARELIAESRAATAEHGDTRHAALLLKVASATALREGDTEEAEAGYAKSFALFQERNETQHMAECAEGRAMVAHARGDLLAAVRWFGAASAMRAARAIPTPSVSRARHDAALATAQTTLGPAAFAAAWDGSDDGRF